MSECISAYGGGKKKTPLVLRIIRLGFYVQQAQQRGRSRKMVGKKREK